MGLAVGLLAPRLSFESEEVGKRIKRYSNLSDYIVNDQCHYYRAGGEACQGVVGLNFINKKPA